MDTYEDNFLLRQHDAIVTLDELYTFRCNYLITWNGEYHLYNVRDIYRYFLETQAVSVCLRDIQEQPFDLIEGNDPLNYVSEGSQYAIVVDDLGNVSGVLDSANLVSHFCREARHQIRNRELQVKNFQRVFDALEDEIFLTDEYGFIQYINPRGEFIIGIHAENWIGHHISELIHRDILPDSLTLQVLNDKQRHMEIVELPTGIRIISSAQAIFDDDGNIVQVLSTSKHIDEITDKISELTRELNDTSEQIKSLQEQIIERNHYIFESPPMKQIKNTLLKIAPADITVLIEGESGSGKEVVADTIYKLSRRKDKPFVKINCGLIPKDLMESELFGYEAGAFTGSLRSGKIGKLEFADGGTIFLDEIGEMELPLQVKLLEFLQDRQITRVGGTKCIPLDIRVIAATNRDLFSMVEQGTFRRDLYYRLNVMPVYIPPLRERREDIVPLLFHFLKMYNEKYGCDKHMDNSVVEKMQNYVWPGNVRELMHTVERIVVASDRDYVNTVMLDELFTEGRTSHGTAITANAKVICTELMPLKDAKHELERYLVKMAYDRFGSSYKAAEFLKVNQSTVSRWLKKGK